MTAPMSRAANDVLQPALDEALAVLNPDGAPVDLVEQVVDEGRILGDPIALDGSPDFGRAVAKGCLGVPVDRLEIGDFL